MVWEKLPVQFSYSYILGSMILKVIYKDFHLVNHLFYSFKVFNHHTFRSLTGCYTWSFGENKPYMVYQSLLWNVMF